MLTEGAVSYLRPLVHDPDAARRISYIPLGGIYWEDELPDHKRFLALPEQDRDAVLELFRLRLLLWRGEPLSPEDRAFWDAARRQAPDYALFRRLEISPDDREAQEKVEQALCEGFAAALAEADDVSVGANGRLTATFHLDTDESDDAFDDEADAKRRKDERIALIVGVALAVTIVVLGLLW